VQEDLFHLTILPTQEIPPAGVNRPLFTREAEALMDIGPLIRTSEERPSSAVRDDLGMVKHHPAQLLELRTPSGPVYVCPTRWQRIRLRWVFRHFHVLPPQVLSPRNQRLIEQLAHSARVTPDLPVPREQIFGVVEKVRLQASSFAAPVVRLATEPVEPRLVKVNQAPKKWEASLPDRRRPFAARPEPIPIRPPVATTYSTQRKARFVRDARFQQWGALGVLAAVCAMVILIRLYDPSLLPATGWQSATSSASLKAAGIDVGPRVIPPLERYSSSALLPYVGRVRQEILLPALAGETEPAHEVAPRVWVASSIPVRPANELERIAAATQDDRLFVSELPQGHFAEPVVTDPSLVGELRLRALIGSDGSVKQVTVVSGNPRLAEAGVRAVRRWRYQALDHPGEAETFIRMRFFGQDGVSIASIAK
jgi:hypothetical protein